MPWKAITRCILIVLMVQAHGPAFPQGVDDTPISTQQYVLFGPLGEASYRRLAPGAPNDPGYAIRKIQSAFGRDSGADNGQARADRTQMWDNYRALLDRLAGPTKLPVVEVVYAFLRETNPLAAQQLTDRPSGLGQHLAEIHAFTRSFWLHGDRSRFPRVLTDAQARLLVEVATPLHDSLKLLGSHRAQVMPDHEVMIAELVRRTFAGKTAAVLGRTVVLTADDARFLADVVGDHENIEKEQGRSERIRSADARDRGRALFFVADVLTGAIVERPEASDRFSFDEAQLDTRFVDLYFRHIDPVKGKIFRPEWGLFAMRDLGTTLKTLVDEHGLSLSGAPPGSTPAQTLERAARAAIERALAADEERWKAARAAGQSRPDVCLTDDQKQRVREVLDSIAR